MIDGRKEWAMAAQDRHEQKAKSMDADALRAENVRLKMIIEKLIGVRLGTRAEKAAQLSKARGEARAVLKPACEACSGTGVIMVKGRVESYDDATATEYEHTPCSCALARREKGGE